MLPALCYLFTALACVSGVTVTQNPPVLDLKKGEEVTMHCNLGSVTYHAVHWYKQVPGGATQFVLQHFHDWSSPKYGSVFSSPKFTSTCSSKSDCNLIIKNVEVGDSAVYYCMTWHDSVKGDEKEAKLKLQPLEVTRKLRLFEQNRDVGIHSSWNGILKECVLILDGFCTGDDTKPISVVFGQGTKLMVEDSAQAPPVLTVLPPSSQEPKSDTATLVCVARHMSVGFADVRWLLDGNSVAGGVVTSSAEQQPDKKFQLSSYLTIDRSEWEKDKAVTCQVSAGAKSSSVQIKRSECGAAA